MNWREVLSWAVTPVEEELATNVVNSLLIDFNEKISSAIDEHVGPQVGFEWDPVSLFTYIKEKAIQSIASINYYDVFAQGT
jgi:hypothetical protein